MNSPTRARGLGDTDPLAKRRAAREAAISGVTGKTRGKTNEAPPRAGKPQAVEPPAPEAAEEDAPPEEDKEEKPPAPSAKTKRSSKPRNSAPRPPAPPVAGGVPMPPPKRGGGARVQFNTRIRPDVSQLLSDFVAKNPATMQDIADMALLEFLAARGFEPTQRT